MQTLTAIATIDFVRRPKISGFRGAVCDPFVVSSSFKVEVREVGLSHAVADRSEEDGSGIEL